MYAGSSGSKPLLTSPNPQTASYQLNLAALIQALPLN
jgi:hypothetical protein